MRGTGIEKEVEIGATNLAKKAKCICTNAKKWGKKFVKFFLLWKNNYCKYKGA
jgi:hypothetical protein